MQDYVFIIKRTRAHFKSYLVANKTNIAVFSFDARRYLWYNMCKECLQKGAAMIYRDFLCEKNLAYRMQREVLPYLRARREEGTFTTADGATLFTVYYRADAPRGSVVILHGMGESAEKYHELCYYLLKNNLSVFLFDQRGHGRSTREAENGIVHIKDFAIYAQDFTDLMTSKLPALPAPHYLFAHSMGGAVAALYLEQGDTPFKKAWLSSPAIAVRIKGAPRGFVRFICAAACATGRGKKRIHVMKPPLPPEKETSKGSSCASLARFEAYRAVKLSDVRLHSAKPSYAWLRAATRATSRMLRKKQLQRVCIPVRILAAERDHLVELNAQRAFSRGIREGSICEISGARHELFNERDAIAHPYFAELLDYFA